MWDAADYLCLFAGNSAAGLTCAAVRYDAIHTQPRLGLKALDEMYHSAKKLAEVVCPSEYGLTRTQRLDIGSTICRNLVEKISRDIRGSVTSYMPKNQKEESSESDDDQVNIRLNPDYLDQEHFVDMHVVCFMFKTVSELLRKFLGSKVSCSPKSGTTSAFQLKYM